MSDTAPSRPILRYHGGKWKLAPWIIGFFPSHRVYVEPFGGAASVLLRKPRSTTEIYNDLDGEVVNLFDVLRDEADARKLREQLIATPYARDEYDSSYQPSDDPVERARRTIIKSFMGMNSKGIFQRSGFDTRVNADGFVSRVNAFVASADMVTEYHQRLRGVVIENSTATDLIDRHDSADTLFYVDPPYMPETRSGKIYRHELTDADHAALAETLHRVQGGVVLSGYPSPLYDQLYVRWERHEIAAHADGARPRTECVWINPACAQRRRAEERQMRMVP